MDHKSAFLMCFSLYLVIQNETYSHALSTCCYWKLMSLTVGFIVCVVGLHGISKMYY